MSKIESLVNTAEKNNIRLIFAKKWLEQIDSN